MKWIVHMVPNTDWILQVAYYTENGQARRGMHTVNTRVLDIRP
jgi:hypothetical protein